MVSSYGRRLPLGHQCPVSLGNVTTTLMSRLADSRDLDPVRPGASATPAILDTRFQPGSPADTSPSVLPNDCLGMPMV